MRNVTIGSAVPYDVWKPNVALREKERLHAVLFNASNDTSEFMEPEIDLKRVKRAEHTTKLKEKLSTMITNDHQNAIFFFFFFAT